jgi:hypothetical protein
MDITIITENNAFAGLCETKVVDFVSTLLDGETDVVAYVLDMFNGARVGDLVTLAIADLAEENGELIKALDLKQAPTLMVVANGATVKYVGVPNVKEFIKAQEA